VPAGVSSSASPALLKGKSRLGRWFILGVLGLLFLVGVGAFFVYSHRSTPTQTLQTACTASKSGDFQTAYDQFSSAFKSKVGNESVFADGQQQLFKSRGGLRDCTVTNVQEEGASVSATIILLYGDGSMITDDLTLIEEHGGWKILSANIRP